jgi:outer membrane protein TolC
MKKSIIFLIIFTFIFTCLLQAEEEIVLTLDEAIALALRDNRDVLLKAEDVKKAKERIAEAQAGLFPTLTVSGSWTDTRGLYEKNTGQTSTQMTLKQYLYKGGKTINTIKQNEYRLGVSQAVLDKTKAETVLNVRQAFYTLLLAGEFADLNIGILENTREHLKTIQARYRSGQASESDVLKVKESLSSVEEAYTASLGQRDSAEALLKNLLYFSDEVKIRTNSQLACEPKELAYDEAFLKAMASRPEIKQHEAQEKADQKSIAIAKSDARPTIYASWDYYNKSHSAGAAGLTKNWNDYNILGITFSWPIFDGWATKHKVEQAIIDLKETQLSRDKAIKDIALELKNAYLDLKNAIAKIKSSQAQAALYKDMHSVAEEKYASGIVSSLDLNDAALGYRVSLFNQAQAAYDYLVAKARFEKAAGG